MICHGKRMPVVTCPKCEQPFKMTRKIIEAAANEWADRRLNPPASECSISLPEEKYKCPRCGAFSTGTELRGEDVEKFAADAPEEDSP